MVAQTCRVCVEMRALGGVIRTCEPCPFVQGKPYMTPMYAMPPHLCLLLQLHLGTGQKGMNWLQDAQPQKCPIQQGWGVGTIVLTPCHITSRTAWPTNQPTPPAVRTPQKPSEVLVFVRLVRGGVVDTSPK